MRSVVCGNTPLPPNLNPNPVAVAVALSSALTLTPLPSESVPKRVSRAAVCGHFKQLYKSGDYWEARVRVGPTNGTGNSPQAGDS